MPTLFKTDFMFISLVISTSSTVATQIRSPWPECDETGLKWNETRGLRALSLCIRESAKLQHWAAFEAKNVLKAAPAFECGAADFVQVPPDDIQHAGGPQVLRLMMRFPQTVVAL